MAKTLICLYQENVADLVECLNEIREHGYDVIVTPIVSSLFYREFDDMQIKMRHLAFSRCDLILESSQWLNQVISKLSDNIDCDSENETVRKHSEKTLLQEISFAEHLIQHGLILYKLKSMKSVNLARILSRNIKGKNIYDLHPPIQNKKP